MPFPEVLLPSPRPAPPARLILEPHSASNVSQEYPVRTTKKILWVDVKFLWVWGSQGFYTSILAMLSLWLSIKNISWIFFWSTCVAHVPSLLGSTQFTLNFGLVFQPQNSNFETFNKGYVYHLENSIICSWENEGEKANTI